jgi:glycine/D-amino acid oxidase-like deaminating enzyme
MCCFLVEDEEGCFYGFPQIDLLGFKVAEHGGGRMTDPDVVDRGLDANNCKRVENFMSRYLVHSKRSLIHHSVCLYTMSPDQHFVVDRFPDSDCAAFVAGLSGHGFKFAPVLGEHLVGLVDGNGNTECDFLGLDRLNGSRK